MSGATVGGGATAGAAVSAVSKLAAQAAAVAMAKVMGSCTADVQAAIMDMIDLGYIQHKDEGLAFCPNGHAFDCLRGACPTCGAEPGDPPSTNELLSPDDEILRDEDRASSDEEDDQWPILADEPGLLERIQRALIECGCEKWQEVALKVAPFWRKGGATDSAAVLQLVTDNGWPPGTAQYIESAFGLIAQEDAEKTHRTADFQPSTEIRIWREGEHLRWEVTDHLAGFTATGRSGEVTLGGVQFRNHEGAVKKIRDRAVDMKAVAEELAKRRKDFFLEPDPVKAKRILVTVPLTQKEVCSAIAIPEPVLSNWCDYRGRNTRTGGLSTRMGVEVDTPHGIIPLAAFFSKPARVKGGEGLSEDAVKEKVKSDLVEHKKQGLKSADIAKEILDVYGIDLSPRTVRKYLSEYSKKYGFAVG